MVLGGRCHKITDVCMDLYPCFKSHNLTPVQQLEHQTWSNNQSQNDVLHV